MSHAVKVLAIENLTHDVLHIVAEKPAALNYLPGQAVDVSINNATWKNELRAFTFTSLPEDNQIEFIIKTYPNHQGVTNQLLLLKKGDELLVGDVFGDIHYKGEGVFIAGGAGITPFIAILKNLEKEQKLGNNQLIFANKTRADIILEKPLQKLLGANFTNVLSGEECEGYHHGFITPELLQTHLTNGIQYFYLCGPPPMMEAVEKQLATLGIASEYIVKEAF
ncbi:MAG: flavodoxin reductase [Chitinophagales bacterium]|nr:flavodoxin reductase [Chitinophagales bacterium]